MKSTGDLKHGDPITAVVDGRLACGHVSWWSDVYIDVEFPASIRTPQAGLATTWRTFHPNEEGVYFLRGRVAPTLPEAQALLALQAL